MIITVDPDRGFHDRVTSAVRGASWAHTAFHVTDPEQAQAVVEAHGVPTVVVVGPRVPVPVATRLTERLADSYVPAFVLLVAEPTNEVLRSALRAGARDVLPPDFAEVDLRSAIEHTGLAEMESSIRAGLTIAVFSAKGGVGTSTLAANLATRFADRIDGETVLLDLDVASADQSIMHALTPQWTLQELVDGTIGTDPESLRGVLLPVDGTTASILPGPLDPALAETIGGDAVTRVIAAARQVAPVLVLDTSSAFDDRTLAAFDAADVIVAASSLDVAALRALTVSLQTMSRIGVDPEATRVALIRADSKSGLQITDVERAIGRDVDVRIPSARAVVRSLNEGVPLAVSQPRSSFVQAIDELVDSIMLLAPENVRRAAEAASRGGGWFGFGRSRSSADDGGDRDTGTDTLAERGPTSSTHPSVPATPPPAYSAPRATSVPTAATAGGATPPVGGPADAGDERAAGGRHRQRDHSATHLSVAVDRPATNDDEIDLETDSVLDSLPPPSRGTDNSDEGRRRFGRRG